MKFVTNQTASKMKSIEPKLQLSCNSANPHIILINNRTLFMENPFRTDNF